MSETIYIGKEQLIVGQSKTTRNRATQGAASTQFSPAGLTSNYISLSSEKIIIADRDPEPSDDITTGIALGHFWINSISNTAFICPDNIENYAIWTDITAGAASGDPDQNLWLTISADSGSTPANSTTETLSILGGANITTSIIGNDVTITGSASGETGPIGATGPAGTDGTIGVDGETGVIGATGPAGTTNHGLLDGLSDDDHTQYLLTDGTRSVTGNLVVTGRVEVSEIQIGGDLKLDAFSSGADTTVFVLNEHATFKADLDVEQDIIVAGTVDSRDVATDGTKLDTIENNADVTDENNVESSLATKRKTITSTLYIGDPTATDEFPIKQIPFDATMVSVIAVTDTGTVDFNIEIRGRLTPFLYGNPIWTLDEVATSSGLEQIYFDSDSINADQRLYYVASATASSPTQLDITVEYTID